METDKATVVFTDEIDSQTFNIISKGEWHLEAEGLKPGYGTLVGQAEWYEVDRMYGEGNATVTIILNEAQLFDFGFEIGNGLLEVEKTCFHGKPGF